MNTKIKYKFFFILLSLLVISSCGESDEDRLERQKSEREAAKSRYKSCEARSLRACEVDPEFTYCGIKYGENVIGSGCTSRIRNIPSLERADFCKAQIKDAVNEMCLIQEFGCKAITGDINCDK